MPKKKQENKEKKEVSVIQDVSLVSEMESSYLDYAMSVIVSRALPDVRDGLKPVHRRILYAMHKMGVVPGGKYKKSAAIVGDVMGKYHPHGDSAIYDAMVRMAQDFSMRYPLVWGQGNFGSMDGDPPAAARYTEAKLQKVSLELLSDIEKDTVDFSPNYDGSILEPSVLPTKLPNLLLNGNMGIAVGMATNIPPHNLNEIVDAIIHLIDNPEATLDDLMQFIQGPDFPTSGYIYGKKDINHVYATGKGGILMRGKAEIIEEKGGHKIIITEVPYQVNKAQLVEKIANLVREKKIEGIKYLGDESNKDGIRVVIELKKDAYPQKVLNLLYKMTPLQDTFHVNMVALAGGIDPQVMPLKKILDEFVGHRKGVVIRRTKFDLAKAEARAHILEGLKKALDVIDQVIKTIKASKHRDDARENLMKKFKFTEIQANAILDMRLQQLANLETKRIVDELKEKLDLIKELKSILASEKKIFDIIKDELETEREKYGDERRTKVVVAKPGEFSAKDLIPEESTIVVMTKSGYIKRMPSDTFKSQGRGGKGVMGLTTKEDDSVFKFFFTTTHNDLLFFTSAGRVFQLKAYDIPQASRTAKGTALVNFLSLTSQERVTAVLSLADLKKYNFAMMVTKKGVIKKVDISQISKIRKSGLIAIKLHEGDELQWVEPTSGKDDIMLVTAKGQSIRFKEENVRAMGRTAAGVRGIKLKSEDVVVAMDVINKKMLEGSPMLMVITQKGYGKRTPIKQYKVQGRGGSGIKTANVTVKTGDIVNANIVDSKNLPDHTEGDVMLISSKGQVIRFSLTSIPSLGRATQGVKLMRFKNRDDQVISADLV